METNPIEMGGKILCIELDKIKEELTSDPLVIHYYRGSGIWVFMERMKGDHDEQISKKFVSSWNNRKVSIGASTFKSMKKSLEK